MPMARVMNVAWTRFLCPGLLHLDTSVYNHPGHKKRVQATSLIVNYVFKVSGMAPKVYAKTEE